METKRPQRPDGRKARTRGALLAAAGKLFTEQGVVPTTVDEIADEASVSVGSLYVHFGNKEALLLALIEDALAINEHYIDAARHAESPLQRVLNVGDAYFRFAIEHTVAFRFVAMRFFEPGPSGPANVVATDQIAARIQRIVTSIAGDLQQAMDDGEIRAAPLDELMAFVWGAWNGVAALMLRPDDLAISPELAERALETGKAVLVQGLRPG